MSAKSRFATILGVPAGGVWLFDTFIANMPIVIEGGLFAVGVAAAWVGADGVRRIVNAATTDKPVVVEAEIVAEAPAAVTQAPAAQALPSPERVQEALQQAFLMGAQAATVRREVAK